MTVAFNFRSWPKGWLSLLIQCPVDGRCIVFLRELSDWTKSSTCITLDVSSPTIIDHNSYSSLHLFLWANTNFLHRFNVAGRVTPMHLQMADNPDKIAAWWSLTYCPHAGGHPNHRHAWSPHLFLPCGLLLNIKRHTWLASWAKKVVSCPFPWSHPPPHLLVMTLLKIDRTFQVLRGSLLSPSYPAVLHADNGV